MRIDNAYIVTDQQSGGINGVRPVWRRWTILINGLCRRWALPAAAYF